MKKAISFLLCLSLATTAAIPAYALEDVTAETNPPETDAPKADSTKIMKGDIAADGIVDVTDLTELSLALIGDRELSDEQMKAADVDDTGEVNLADLAKIRQFLSKKIPSLENIPENDPSKMPYDFFITLNSSSDYRELKEALELDSEEFSKYLIKTNNGIRTKKQAEEFISAVDKVSMLGNIKGNINSITYDNGGVSAALTTYEYINISIKTDDEKRVSYEFLPFSEPSELYQGWADTNCSIYETPLQNNAGNFRVYAVSEPERSTDPYIIIAGINDITVRIMYYTDNADDVNIQSWLDWTTLVSVEDYDKPEEIPQSEPVTPQYYYDVHFNSYKNLSDNLLATLYEIEDESRGTAYSSEAYEKLTESLKETKTVRVPFTDGEEPVWRNKEGFYNISLVYDLFSKPCLFFHFADEGSNSYIKITDVSEELAKTGADNAYDFLKAMSKSEDGSFFKYDQSEKKQIELADGSVVEAIFGKYERKEDESAPADTRVYVHFLYEGSFVTVCCRTETIESGFLEKFSLKDLSLSDYRFDSTPLFMIIDSRMTDTEYGERKAYFNHVFTADGNSYNCDAVVFNPVDYESAVSTYMTIGKKNRELAVRDEAILKKAAELVKNASSYKDCSMIEFKFAESDECDTSLELIYTDENGELQPLYIYYNHGEYGSWRDNAEIQEFISLLIENGYLEGKHFLETAGVNEGTEKKKITMDELNELSKKGDELSASDLEKFEYTEKGNGSAARQYDIADDDDKFRFTVEFTDESCTDILSAELYSVEVDAVTDIREVTVAQFLHMIRNQIESSEDK